MSIGVFMRDRSTTSAVVVLAIVLGASTLLWYWLAPAPKVNDFVGPPRSAYTLTTFTLDSYDETGKPAYRLVAPRLEQRDGDDSIYINAPDYILHSAEPGVPDWTGKSDYAWVNKPGTLMKLQGKVEMHRQRSPTRTPPTCTPPRSPHGRRKTAWRPRRRSARCRDPLQ